MTAMNHDRQGNHSGSNKTTTKKNKIKTQTQSPISRVNSDMKMRQIKTGKRTKTGHTHEKWGGSAVLRPFSFGENNSIWFFFVVFLSNNWKVRFLRSPYSFKKPMDLWLSAGSCRQTHENFIQSNLFSFNFLMPLVWPVPQFIFLFFSIANVWAIEFPIGHVHGR